MCYQLKPFQCRPWTLSYLSVKLIESHYENNYGGALRRLNAITEQLESLDFEKTPAHVLNGLKREQLGPKSSRATSARSIAGARSSGRWDTPSAADRVGFC